MKPDRNRVSDLIDYDPTSGVFKHKTTRGGVREGDIAGVIHKSTGYRRLKIDGRGYQASNIAWLLMTGEWPKLIDHRDLDRANDVFDNLRKATSSQNGANRQACKTNGSGIKGVRWRIRNGKGCWVAQIKKDNKVQHLGHFNQKNDAAAAYQLAAQEAHAEFARF